MTGFMFDRYDYEIYKYFMKLGNGLSFNNFETQYNI